MEKEDDVTLPERFGANQSDDDDESTTEEFDLGPLLAPPISTGTAMTIGRRPSQQDGLVCVHITEEHVPKMGCGVDLFAVFDGHGGSTVMSWLCQNIVSWTISMLGELDSAEDVNSGFMFDFFQSIDHGLRTYVRERMLRTCGSTATIVLGVGDRLLVANIGDSSAAMVDTTTGRIVCRTAIHKPKKESEERQRHMDIVLGRLGGCLAVSRSFGDLDMIKHGLIWEPAVQVWLRSQHQGHALIIASDGLWDMCKGKADLGQFFGDKAVDWSNAVPLAEALKDRAKELGTMDNVAVIAHII